MTTWVDYKYLKEKGIVASRVQLARAIGRYDFPAPAVWGDNSLRWNLEWIDAWTASRPRRRPKTSPKKPSIQPPE